MRNLMALAVVIAFAAPVAAQTPPAQTPAAQAPAPQPPASPPAAATPAPATQPVDCRAQAQSKGLRGQDARDSTAVCVQEQRLACIKEAVDKKIVGPQRRDFMRTCAGRRGGKKS